MKVVQAYNKDNPRLARYVSLLMQAMPADVECVVCDCHADLRRACDSFHPDIIHQHGRFAISSLPPARLIVSPHGEATDNDNTYAVIARSPYELQKLKAPRKELVRNPLITTTITFDEAATAIHAIYQRVIDSHPLELMDSSTRLALATMLKAGLLGDKEWVADSGWKGDMASIDLRHLFIYAEQEGVLDIVQRGIETLGADETQKPQEIGIYLPADYRKPTPMAGATILELLRDIELNGVTLLRLTELTRALYSDDLDEEALMNRIETEKLKPFFQTVLQVLSEQTLLTEGFMPCPPLDNDDTQQLRWQIENHLNPLPPIT